MMRKLIIIILIWLLPLPAIAEQDTGKHRYDYHAFSLLPILHQGRIKPLASFARLHLKLFTHSETLPIGSTAASGKLTASAWLAEAILTPEASYQRPLFKIRSKALIDILSLKGGQDNSDRYSFYEITQALRDNQQLVNNLRGQDFDQLTPAQQELLNLAQKTVIYFEISRTMTLFDPIFTINNRAYATELGLDVGTNYNYLEAIRSQPQLIKLLQQEFSDRQANDSDNLVDSNLAKLLSFGNLLDSISNDRNSLVVKVLPTTNRNDLTWTSPWENIATGGNPSTARLFSMWQELINSYNAGPNQTWLDTTETLLSTTLEQADYPLWRLELEYFYNRAELFKWGMLLYIFALLLMFAIIAYHSYKKLPASADEPVYKVGYKFMTHKFFYRLTYVLVGSGLILQINGIVIRTLLLNRPPVTNFYESLLFVTAACVLGGLVFEHLKRQHHKYRGLALAATSGIGLSLLSFYNLVQEDTGDSMQMLIAVLNTNYWLATHVVVITLGYAASIIAGLLGHIYLGNYVFQIHTYGKINHGTASTDLSNSIFAMTLIALFLMVFGTILGGIWADQSWGRFWGWDPKENGALLIVLWLTLMLHSRLTALVKKHIFAAAAVILNVAVALSWYGVNLLNIGLHSYGFIDSGRLIGLSAFIIIELLFVLICLEYGRIKLRFSMSSPKGHQHKEVR